jgi:hypothetical protein
MVVLAHLRRRWRLSGREGSRFLSPSRRACEVGFDIFCGSKMPIFFIAPKARNGGESLGCLSLKNFDRTLDRTRSRMDLRVRSVAAAAETCVLGFRTGASDQTPRGTADHKVDRTRCASGHDRPDASGREWTLTGLKPDIGCSASDRLSRAFGHSFDHWNVAESPNLMPSQEYLSSIRH